MFRSEIGSGFEDPGGTPPPRIPRSTPPGELVTAEPRHLNGKSFAGFALTVIHFRFL